jgi:cytochrome b pre-mRNA-processing protein 3
MILFRRDPNESTIRAFYGAIVAQARLPCFYRDFGVPDTVMGRFDMIVLHAVLVLRQMQGAPAMGTIGQGVFDAFCRDMDHNLREMGVGDLGVPRQMRRLAEAFYGRARTYESALAAADDAALVAALARNIFPDAAQPHGARRLAAYMRAADRSLAEQGEVLARGEPQFPNPERFGASLLEAEPE